MANHYLKLKRHYFEEKINGVKDWEIRENDRDFKVDDTVFFNEVVGDEPTGRTIKFCRITGIFHGGPYGLQTGYCIFQHSKGYRQNTL
jgi:hypothetical protein